LNERLIWHQLPSERIGVRDGDFCDDIGGDGRESDRICYTLVYPFFIGRKIIRVYHTNDWKHAESTRRAFRYIARRMRPVNESSTGTCWQFANEYL